MSLQTLVSYLCRVRVLAEQAGPSSSVFTVEPHSAQQSFLSNPSVQSCAFLMLLKYPWASWLVSIFVNPRGLGRKYQMCEPISVSLLGGKDGGGAER